MADAQHHVLVFFMHHAGPGSCMLWSFSWLDCIKHL